MSCQLIVRPEAEADLVEAFDWYDDRRAGLGNEFLTAVDTALEQIIENPLRFAVLYRNVRRTLVRRFPYKVFFYTKANQAVVIGIIHVKRHPRVWQSRV
jgi:plasmid stabilization system protein ParE